MTISKEIKETFNDLIQCQDADYFIYKGVADQLNILTNKLDVAIVSLEEDNTKEDYIILSQVLYELSVLYGFVRKKDTSVKYYELSTYFKNKSLEKGVGK